MSESESNGTSSRTVIVVLALVFAGAAAWIGLSISLGGGVSPERAETWAEEAERECVLDGVSTDRCKELVGRHHRACLQEAERAASEPDASEKAARKTYMSCIEKHVRRAESEGSAQTESKEDATE